ncbi:MAG: flagellar biosynthesis protein FlhF [Burkholderiales bacterium]
MNVRKFHASSTREALRQVRDALGAEALILSNKQVAGGVEIIAVADMDMAALGVPETTPRSGAVNRPGATAGRPAENGGLQAGDASVPPADTPALDNIVQEITRVRSLLEGQLAGLAWGELQRQAPHKVEALRVTMGAGFSPTLARQFVENLPEGYDRAHGEKWVKAALVHNLSTMQASRDIVDSGGVYALMGTTGVGKTTTVAKLAARYTLKHGAAGLALLTTDSYRIGAHEHLKIYGNILGVPVYAVRDETELQMMLGDLQDRRLILIDTVGTSQRDRRLADQVAMLCGEGRSVKRLLLLGATSQGCTLDDVVRAYRGFGIEGCILTKIDEAMSLGPALDVIIRYRLDLYYVTNGQRVPEDLHLANKEYLIDRAFRAGVTPFTPQREEYALLAAVGGGTDYRATATHLHG